MTLKSFFSNLARNINGKFKKLWARLRKWSKFSQFNKLINYCSWSLVLSDGLDDQRVLNTVDRNFSKIVYSHLHNLLEAKRLYWKQRSTIRWLKFGDENSSPFQAMATISFRRNYIASLLLQDGTTITDHSLKAGSLWSSFKERLGTTKFQEILFDLDSLIDQVDLPEMDRPFSKEEIDMAVKEMASDHAPGPDGFNGFFMKRC